MHLAGRIVHALLDSTWVPKNYRLDMEFGCLTNAENLAKLDPRLHYVEGWARLKGDRSRKAWGAHAWCIAPNGSVVDPYFDCLFPGKQIDYREDSGAFNDF